MRSSDAGDGTSGAPAERDIAGWVTSAGGVVYRGEPPELLLGEQVDWNTGARNVRLPKGHLDPGESLEEAAVREVAEETGRRARVVARLGESRYEFTVERDRSRVRKRVVYFLLEDLGPADAPPDGEMQRLFWCGAEEARARLSFANERDAVARALAALAADSGS